VTYPADEDRKAIRIAVIIIALAIAAALLASCGEARSPVPIPSPPSVADQIRSLGTAFLRYGGLILGLGMVLRGVVWAATFLTFTGLAGRIVSGIVQFIGPFVGLGAVAGGLSVAFGACCVWMADYLPVAVGAGIAACVALAVYYWPRIRRWLPARLPSRN